MHRIFLTFVSFANQISNKGTAFSEIFLFIRIHLTFANIYDILNFKRELKISLLGNVWTNSYDVWKVSTYPLTFIFEEEGKIYSQLSSVS